MSAQDGRAVELATERLWIRSLTEADWPAMKRIWADFGRSAYAAYDRPFPTADADIRALTRQFADSGLFFAVFRSDRREMIGYVCFHRIAGRYDLGYCFHSASHAHGYAGESAAALIRYLAEAHGARAFSAETALDNAPSCRLLRRLGFSFESAAPVSFDGKFTFLSGRFRLTLQSDGQL